MNRLRKIFLCTEISTIMNHLANLTQQRQIDDRKLPRIVHPGSLRHLS